MITHTHYVPSRILASAEDRSVNFVWDLGPGAAVEARYVRREDDYFIAYLSSHTGCNQSCRFCHLTATKQVDFGAATLDDFVIQAHTVLTHYETEVSKGKQVHAQRVNFNWMARGEPLLNPIVANHSDTLFAVLAEEAAGRGLVAKFNISTIIPQGVTEDTLRRVFADPRAQLYYSLYSLDADFRRRWLPKAQDPTHVLDMLARLQTEQHLDLVLHWAFIDGENDSAQTVEDIAAAVKARGLRAKFNLVRYNPFSERQGRESPEHVLLARFDTLKATINAPGTRMVPRVGFDVKASCGMFVHPAESDAT